MKNFLFKELRLAAHPTLFIFTALGVLVLVPDYPYGAIFCSVVWRRISLFNTGEKRTIFIIPRFCRRTGAIS